MTNRKRRCSLYLLGMTALAAQAATEPDTAAALISTAPTALVARLHARYPATRFGVVNTTPWPGVFEVMMGGRLAYVDASGQYFLFGHLFDMQAQRDITAERQDSLTRIDVAALPLDDALKEVRGNGQRMLVIFSDPDCPYCRRLEATLKELSDVTIYTFLLPFTTLHPAARGHAIAVWCAADRLQAWHALMQGDEPRKQSTDAPTTPSTVVSCAHPIDRNVALGERLGINGTPTLVAQDGRVLPGVGTLAQIEAWLGSATASSDSSTSTQRLAQ